jgi:hypothetical protein
MKYPHGALRPAKPKRYSQPAAARELDTDPLSCSDASLGSAGGPTPLCARKLVGADEPFRDLDVSDSTSASAT